MTSGRRYTSVLVANRGEIAVRIIRTLRRLGIRAIAVFSEADAGAPHVRLADEAVALGPAPAAQSYLDAERILAAVRSSGAQALHPGYGFLSESPGLARACPVTWIGPPPEAIELLGDKAAAKRLAARAGVPVLAGIERPGLRDEEILAWARRSADRLPLMVKAAAGGGGRGIRVVRTLEELAGALTAARREALAGFGDDALLAERLVEPARHVEIQFLADAHGHAVHLGERECSLQRRHQKLVEECPSPAISEDVRERMGRAAVALARAAGYVGAGTCEFLVSADDPQAFWFLEVNARLQVEHPVTELVYGLDLVEAQLRIAAGEPLPFTQEEVVARGHAIEARICAEDAERGFLPAGGRIVALREPAGPGIRVDSGVCEGSDVTTHYDSLLAKVVAHGPDRETALERLDGALAATAILGPPTNTSYLRHLLRDGAVRAGRLDTGLVARVTAPPPARRDDEDAAVAAALAQVAEPVAGDDPWDRLRGWRLDGLAPQRRRMAPQRGGEAVELLFAGGAVRVAGGPRRAVAAERQDGGLAVAIDGRRRLWSCGRDRGLIHVGIDGRAWAFRDEPLAPRRDARERGAALEAPMPGSVLDVRVTAGDRVRAGDVLLVLESMKMELEVVAPQDGRVERMSVCRGDRVSGGQVLVAIGGEPR
jgi:acetyl-CoA/propionyl-CoA carboxylase, biotin carboxylase, biotin carboxyl carrier protein